MIESVSPERALYTNIGQSPMLKTAPNLGALKERNNFT